MPGKRKLALLIAVVLAGASAHVIQNISQTTAAVTRADSRALAVAAPRPTARPVGDSSVFVTRTRIAQVETETPRPAPAAKGLPEAIGILMPTDPLPDLADLAEGARGLPIRLAALGDAGIRTIIESQRDLSPFGLPCDENATIATRPDAILRIHVEAPCRPYAILTVAHAGITISGMTSHIGSFDTEFPALESPANVTVRVENGAPTILGAEVPDIDRFERVALGWEGDAEFRIVASRDGKRLKPGTTLREMRLGDPAATPARMAEVFSYPVADETDPGIIRLALEVPVTKGNCGGEARARLVRKSPGFDPEAADLAVAVPDCSAVGEYLVLKNLLRDVRIARN